ncbi:AMP-binding protein [Shewanella sp. UCD-KL12]|uniref:AMP-binding protein n=1 Tax=Shewanella sp. UCD-KL12 TaxID=1917163 RepID=UPI000970375C|nr:AMP-binding protein [Shewanella sp. UCD-KL12]
MTELLKSWLSKGPASQQLISFNHHDIVTGAAFTCQVAHIHQQLSQSKSQRWLLACESSDLFAVGLCAALLAGKEVILPANTQPGSLSELTHEFDRVISDKALCEGKVSIALKKEQSASELAWPTPTQWGQITLFTSGSSGQPKAVRKTLTQLDAEVTNLEYTFAKHLPQCSVISTVSHQHIYGLLFKVLWPLAASRPFLSDIVEYPETLTYYTSLFPNLCLISSPAQLSRLPESLDNERQLRSPSLVFSSGGPLNFEAAQGIAHCYGHQPIEIFGSTETGGIAFRRQTSKAQAWQTFSKVEVAQDPKDGALVLKSPYLENNEWLRCEDKINLIEPGRFQLEGRLDRIVKVEEKRVSLVQMEALLDSHPLVSQSALVPLTQPRPQLGVIIALSAEGKALLEAEGKLSLNNLFKTHLLSQFERVTLPRRWRYPDTLPQNEQGKRIQTELTELFDND